jgi:ABC-type multidrug transport system fused ATPase/permease subunit
MEQSALIEFICAQQQLLPMILSVILVICILVFIAATKRLRRLERAYRSLLGTAAGGEDIEEIVLEYIRKADTLQDSLEQTQSRLQHLEDVALSHIQNVGVVRYDAFDGIGGEQSFSVALLDANANGVVVSGLSGREDTRVYAKPVRSGRSAHVLSDEEIQAIAGGIINYIGGASD